MNNFVLPLELRSVLIKVLSSIKLSEVTFGQLYEIIRQLEALEPVVIPDSEISKDNKKEK